jgi:quercetin dioxygenase-like cupin family protein
MTDPTTREEPDQRRRPPRERFAGVEHLFDLAAEAAALGREPTGERDGHRQITLFRRDEVTVILFDFEADGHLLEHAADGHVMIQVLRGELQVSTPGGDHAMPAGSLLVLAPGVRHDVRAVTTSRMLLTVCL